MHRLKIPAALGIVFAIVTFLHGLGLPVSAKTEVRPDVEIQGEDKESRGNLDKTVKDIKSAFEKAEEAMKAGDLDALMTFYSKDYEYHGLKKDDIRKIWSDLLGKYSHVKSTHLLSKFIVKGKGKAAEVTCSGNLWATSKSSVKRENIDSWFEEVHFMVLEDGAWRVRGSHGEARHSLQFGTAPHPLF